jgi:hypothetical protein
MTFIAVRCPHCDSKQSVKRGKPYRGIQRSLGPNTVCTRGVSAWTPATEAVCPR